MAVLKGTEVRVQVFPTMKTTAGRLALDEDKFADLAPQPDGSLIGQLHRGARRLLSRGAGGAERRARDRIAAVHRRRAGRSRADRVVRPARPRHHGVGGRGGVRRGQGRRRLRRARSGAGLLGERRRREGGQAVRRPAPAARGVGRPHVLHGRAGRAGRRLGVLLRARDGQRRRRRRQARHERPLLPARPAVLQGLPPGAVAGRRRRWRRRRRQPGRGAVRAAAADHLGDVQRAA